MSVKKVAKVSCEDCFFRRNLLCALDCDAPPMITLLEGFRMRGGGERGGERKRGQRADAFPAGERHRPALYSTGTERFAGFIASRAYGGAISAAAR